MKLFKTNVNLTNGSEIEIDVRLDWHSRFEEGDYDFDFSLWHKGARVLDKNIIHTDIDRITSMVDTKVRMH